MDDLMLLRLHVAAVWSLRLPPLAFGDVLLAPDSPAPTWTLYCAMLAGGAVRIWRHDVASEARAALSRRVEAALRLPPSATAAAGIRREVALVRRSPRMPYDGNAAQLARRLGPRDAALLEAYEPGEVDYYLHPDRAPLVGVIVGGQLVSVAHSSRRTREACELGIGTLPDGRRRGYARAATLCWTSDVAAEGLVPLYSALASNDASLALAAAAGYRRFARGAYVMLGAAT